MQVARFKRALRMAKVVQRRGPRRKRLPRKLQPQAIEREYYRRIEAHLARAVALVRARVEPQLGRYAAEAARQRNDSSTTSGRDERLDASGLNDLMDALAKEFGEAIRPVEIEAIADQFARRTSDFEKEQAAGQVRAAFGVDVLAAEPNLAAKTQGFIAENVSLIKSVPQKYLADVEARVSRAVSAGATAAQLAKELVDAKIAAESRAALIARDQIGKFYGRVAEARQVAMGVTHFVWRTSNDERVREEHAELEGERFAWDDLPSVGAPGFEINCRCYAEPDLSPLLEGDEPIAQSAPDPDDETLTPERNVPAEPNAVEWEAFAKATQAQLGISVDEASVRAALTPPAASGLSLRVETVETEPRLTVTSAITRDGDKVGVITRTFGRDPDGKLWVKHDDFGLDPKEQGRGVGEAILKKSLAEYKRLGFDEVRLTATDVGRYSWAKAGFQWDEATAVKFEPKLSNFLESRGVRLPADQVSALARDPRALAVLERDGVKLGKDFLLSPAMPRWNGVYSLGVEV